MALSAGDKLGPYEIVEAIGQGGMGAVYRARDTRLGRDVAVKVSEQRFGERFEREARAISSLNHPNICTLFDVGPNYLVMELVEGQTLSERIKEGPIPHEESLHVAWQIAAALEAAHEKGIVHRDLKPGNVIVKDDETVKVLDFGLAKVARSSSASREAAHGADATPEMSPTISMAATQAGVILGTAAYMSPEQARGKAVDKRADIWAFGVVLYEMVTGKKLFAGEDLTDTLASVVKTDPDLSDAPRELQPLLKKCLEKDPRKRLRDIGGVEAFLELGKAASQAATPAPAEASSATRLLPWGIAAAALAALGIVWFTATGSSDSGDALVRLNLDLPGYFGTVNGMGNFALSPDGKRIAYVTDVDGTGMLATRLLEEEEATILPGTEEPRIPFFSPDGGWIGFWQDGRVKKVSVQGGPPLDLANAPGLLGASWGEDGYIVGVLSAAAPMSRFPDSGGEPEMIIRLDDVRGHRFPQVLSGGKTILFGTIGSVVEIRAVDLATKEVKTLIQGASFGKYLPTGGAGASGHLVYGNQGTLLAVPFDLPALEVRGDPVPVLSDMASVLAFSDTGALLYRQGAPNLEEWEVDWLRSSGELEPILTEPARYSWPRVSPDGNRIALVRGPDAATEVIVYDTRNDRTTLLTQPGEVDTVPIWSPDGKYLAMQQVQDVGSADIVWKRADGSGETVLLLDRDYPLLPSDISPDGRYLAFHEVHSETGFDMWVAPLDLSDPDHPVVGEPEEFLRTPGVDDGIRFSADGKWVTYFTTEGGLGTYVQPFPGPGPRYKISDTGYLPMWSGNGREILMSTGANDGIYAVDYEVNGETFVAGRFSRWASARLAQATTQANWDANPDGERVLMFHEPEAKEDSGPRFGYLENFFSELRRRAPAR